MQNINVDFDYFEHPKTRRLVGLLGKGSEMLPLKLWVYTGKYHAEHGRLTDHSAQEIEACIGWWGTSGVAVLALVKVGFLDDHGGQFAVHDWVKHQGHIHMLKVKAQNAANARWNKPPPEQAGNASRNAAGNAQALPEHSSNQPTNHLSPPNPRKRGRRRERDDEIDRKLREDLPPDEAGGDEMREAS